MLTRSKKRLRDAEIEAARKYRKMMFPDETGIDGYGFKKCGKYIVDLQILGENNEGRKGIRYPSRAKYRCSKARVLGFWDLDGNPRNDIERLPSDRNPEFVYTLGEVVEEPKFDPNLEKVCSHGIHYYLRRDIAMFCTGEGLENYSGPFFRCRDDGTMWIDSTYKNGKTHGCRKVWDESGQLYSQCMFEAGKAHGECLRFRDGAVIYRVVVSNRGAYAEAGGQ